MATLSIDNVKKSFGEVEVIHGVSVDVDDGEFIVIVGPSGCGKSTLLRMVAGLETVSGGQISIDAQLVNDKEPMDRDIAMVFQNYALYPHMSVRQNMAYGLKIAKMPKPQINDKVLQAAKLLQLEEYLDRKPRELSGGQRQRVAMGRAIVREPAVFLFDEPLSNLDAKLRVQMRLEIKQLQSDLGVTSLYVTHDQVEAMTMADRMIVMNQGVAEQIGTPLEVYERPQSLFAAQFIGSPAMNVFDGNIEDGVLSMVNGSVLPGSYTAQGAVKVGIRPEHLTVNTGGGLRSDDGLQVDVGLQFDVGFTEPLGATTLLHGKLVSSGEAITVSLPGVHSAESLQGATQLGIDTEQIHIFSGSTGMRL